jgi:hypothetical protein
MNKPVTLELAKLLKSKNIYFKGTSVFFYETVSTDSGVFVPDLNIEILEGDYTEDLCFPTIADVIMWLYDKHDIWIFIERNGWFWTIEMSDNKTIHQEDLPLTEWSIWNGFKEPVAAYQSAIKYCLNNLI